MNRERVTARIFNLRHSLTKHNQCQSLLKPQRNFTTSHCKTSKPLSKNIVIMAESNPPVDGGASDMRQPLMTTILEHVERGEAREVGVIMESRSIAEQLKCIAWDLVPQVCTYLTNDTLHTSPAVIDTVETVLSQLALKAKPKEVLLVLLEQADTFKDDIKFKTLLPAIQTCLLQLPSKRGHSIAIATETLYAHIAALTLPEHPAGLQGEERKLMENDDQVVRLNDVTRAMIDFLQPLGEKMTYRDNGGTRSKDASEQKELVRCHLKLLNHPVADTATLHRAEKDTVKTDGRLNAERLMSALSLVQPDYVKLITQIQEENFRIDVQREAHTQRKSEAVERGDIPDIDDDYDVEEKYSELSLAVLAYLAYGEGLGLERHPHVYTPQFVFEFCLPHVTRLLHHESHLVVEKGVKLLQGALDRVPDGSMSAAILEWTEVGRVVGYLIQVMTKSQDKDTSTAAVAVLPLWLRKFDAAGKHKSLYFILMKEKHAGLVGYTVQLLKNEVDRALREAPSSDASQLNDEYFTGSQLEKLLDLVLTLPHGVQTDVLDQSDRIMAALNLLRYLVIRDGPGANRTGVWNYMVRVQDGFCTPLRTAIDMARAHYQLEMKHIKEGTSQILGQKKEKTAAGGAQMQFEVGGRALPGLTPQQEVEVMQTALHTFDMIQSVLVRTEEVIDQQKRSAAKQT